MPATVLRAKTLGRDISVNGRVLFRVVDDEHFDGSDFPLDAKAELPWEGPDEGAGLVDAAYGVHDGFACGGVEDIGGEVEGEIESARQAGFVHHVHGLWE